MKERIVELEKHRNINTVPSKAVEEDFTIEATEKGLSFNYYYQSFKFIFQVSGQGNQVIRNGLVFLAKVMVLAVVNPLYSVADNPNKKKNSQQSS